MHHSSRGLACMLVSVFLGGILTFAFSSSSAQAQAVCVAPLSGPWSTVESGEIREPAGTIENSILTDGRLELVGEYGGAFVLHGGGASYTFVRSDETKFGNVVYMYIDPTGAFTVRLDVETRERMKAVSVSQTGVSRRFTVNYQGSVPERAPECDCPGLDAFLHERIEDGRKMQALYANPAYWERPPGWPPPPTGEFDTDPWNGNTYDRVIDGLATGKSYGEAVEELLPQEAGEEGDGGLTVDPSRPQTAEESGTLLTASTNPKTCEITINNAHFGTPFPWIAREQTLVHEQTHRGECQRRDEVYLDTYNNHLKNPRNKGLDEVAGYQADINFISTWKAQNCE